MSKTHPLIPVGEFCYRIVELAPGEVLSREHDRYGRDLREFPYHRGTKCVLCPYWQRTNHGTVRCEYLGKEVLDDEAEDWGQALALATEYFGAGQVDQKVGRSWALADEIKVCGVNEDADEGDEEEGEGDAA